MLYLNLFGRLSVARRDGANASHSVDLAGRPGSLLAYLALAKGRYFTRSELITTLWPEQTESISIGSFNTTLWRLRKALEKPPLDQTDIVVCDSRGALGLPTDAQLQLDVDEFALLVNPGLLKPIEQLDESDINNLRRGVGLYRDDILVGFTDDWALRERELHRRRLLSALARLMHVSTLARDYASAIRYAQDMLDRDTLREDIHRELMQLFLLSGQRAMALRQFELCRAALRKELAIQPMRETLVVYQRIADSAIGRETESHRSATHDALPTNAHHPMDVMALDAGTLSAREMVQRARYFLAQADAQLQLSLPLFD
ncbi:BTAD domain-containing putative transcriptional regulator [Accumulibacter sp.]|uniref:AfsR/SARP family transcriptional regulator n=1 Tax=Accumulibacter sp. TaxID=2053492 RepID=UPI001AD5D137|nr:BTAD domain-containing putative transcriptional regulator [Accumulibacter sp.]MBN8498628.1 winged helix-turn-helix domain-containing protein [Accumulibacter sp.]